MGPVPTLSMKTCVGPCCDRSELDVGFWSRRLTLRLGLRFAAAFQRAVFYRFFTRIGGRLG